MKEIKDILEKNNELFDQIISRIKKAKLIAVIGHINPDGDCIGSQMGICSALKSIGIQSDLINEGVFKSNFKDYEKYFLNDINKEYDLFIIVDVSSRERIGTFHNNLVYENTIVIDHHQTNEDFAGLGWVSNTFLSASEMVYILLVKMKIDLSYENIAQNLLNGVLYDNGFYQHIRVNKTLSLLVTYLLIEAGADPNITYDMMFRNNSISNIKLFSMVLNRIESANDGRVFYTYLTEKDKINSGNADFESGELFSQMKSITGFQIGIFFKIYESENRVDVSFRSVDTLNVGAVAAELGGGGHKVAAGVSIRGNFKEIKKNVLDKINVLMDRAGEKNIS